MQDQVILLLGGDRERETSAGRIFAEGSLPIIVSSGHQDVEDLLLNEGVTCNRVRIDKQAVDTVTNFTTLVKDFVALDIRHVLLVTSDYHMPRAAVIGRLIFHGAGIWTTPHPITTSYPPTSKRVRSETKLRTARDVARALLWMVTGVEMSGLGRFVHPERFSHHN